MSRQRRQQSEGTQQTRVRAWAGLKSQVHDKSQTREPTGERCGSDVGAMETIFLEPMLEWQPADTVFFKPMLQNGFDQWTIYGRLFYRPGRRHREGKGDVTWNARGATRAQGPLQPVEATHKENNK